MTALPAPIPFQLGATFQAGSGIGAELTVHGGGRTQFSGYAPRRRFPPPSWDDLQAAGAAASIAGPVGGLIAGGEAAEVSVLISAGVFGVWHYARRYR